MTTTSALQLCPFSERLTQELARRFDLVRWFEMAADERERFLAGPGKGVRAVVTGGHVGCDDVLMSRLPALGIVAINGVGFDKVDLVQARARDVRVTNTPDVLTEDVADLAVGLVIGLLRRLPQADRHVREGRWRAGDMTLARKVSGRRFGIVGLGRIGSAIAARLAPFGPIAYTDLAAKDVPYSFEADLLALASRSDVLVLASSADASTRHLVGVEVLKALGREGYLVNVARGSLVDEAALVAALNDGVIAGAALDVFENEPAVPQMLIDSDATMLSPHVASATWETRNRMADVVLANLDAFFAGRRPPTSLT